MAKKELWDDETTIREFYDAYNYLDNIPKRYLKMLSRTLHLHISYERLRLQSVANMEQLATIQGGIHTLFLLLTRIDAIIAGNAKRLDADEALRAIQEANRARERYDDTFGIAGGNEDEYFEG